MKVWSQDMISLQEGAGTNTHARVHTTLETKEAESFKKVLKAISWNCDHAAFFSTRRLSQRDADGHVFHRKEDL